MSNPNINILDAPNQHGMGRRRDLIPIWIKVFIWIFMIIGAMAPFGFITSLFMDSGYNTALYGLETNQPLSLLGIFITLLFLFKGITAYGLWNEMNWAVSFAIVDAIIGIITTISITIINISSGTFSIGLELIALIPYLIKMLDLREPWSTAERKVI